MKQHSDKNRHQGQRLTKSGHKMTAVVKTSETKKTTGDKSLSLAEQWDKEHPDGHAGHPYS